ncbi:AAA domain-containing protein [uncultured Desulfosarcina sp.]|uniref:AAA domain-containing protein n=1 Tax=uncultured Desulfosarcina sp. TaxID=218289 RepID=UPI0029C6AC51|nr:AAA domain-containing protein [uncultured Desulfosarcina sp.]
MEQVEKTFPELREQVLMRLNKAGRPLTTRELGSRLRAARMRIPDYQIAAQLSILLKEESVSLEGNRWRFIHQSGIESQDVAISLPILSSDTNEQLGWRRTQLEDRENDPSEPSEPETTEPEETDGGAEAAWLNLTARWALFRKLVAYYRQCIRNEEGADASAYQNQLGERFIYLRKVGHWHPWPGTPWQSSIPLGDHLAGLLRCLPGPTDEDTLVVGYPIHGYFKERPGEPPISVIRPIFYFPVEYTINLNNLLVRNNNPKLEINFNWLEYAFSRRRESQGSFLSACGFINRSRPNDEVPGLELGETSPNLQSLSSALKSFMPDKIFEPLNIDSVTDIPLNEPFNTGIYNRAVLMVAKKTRFSVTLLKELAAIEKAPDEVLDQTALRMLFSKNDQPRQSPDNFIHEELVIDTTRLNAEQRWAVASLINQPLTVVTGPPGTGKSQVVSAAATNARLHNQTVLFASRNHKAIDAVYNRLIDDDGRPLIVRTNSKDDPNLNYTFYKAIKDLLRDQPNPDGAKRISFLREEISQLLVKRGESARVARQWAKIGTELGEIEERMGYLSCEFPDGMASFLDFNPSLFPQRNFKRISKIAKNMAQESNPQTFRRRFSRFWRCWMLMPWYRLAIKRLKAIPGSPKLPPWPTPEGLGTVFQDFLLLEKAAEYAQLRISSKSIEEKSRELPPLEDLTVSLADVTERLKKTAHQAMQLDLDSRRGLPEDANREELMGLNAALLAKL